MSLTNAIRRARNICGPNEVWCITRFDRNNSTIEIYWSERTIVDAVTSYNLAGGLRNYGDHAECIMIRDFDRALTDYGQVPDIVEIFISRSPCMVSAGFNHSGIAYPIGCASKIVTLIGQHPNIRFWDLRHDDVYWGNLARRPDPNSNILSSSVTGISILASLPNVSIHKFSDLDIIP